MKLPLLCHNKISSQIETKLPAFIMGIINATPDSFWKESRSNNHFAAEKALQMIEDGADIIDIGGESTRPGSKYIDVDIEIQRVVPVVEEIRRYSDCPISIDTRHFEVMKATHEMGADILNDISALEDDENMVGYIANEKIPVILMHKRGNPDIMQNNTNYSDVFREVNSYLCERVCFAIDHGVDSNKIFIDPGIGFGKGLEENCTLIKNCGKLCNGDFPIVMALSRKSFIGEITGREVEQRLSGTLTANFISVMNGAKILRVHDVKETKDMLKMMEKLK